MPTWRPSRTSLPVNSRSIFVYSPIGHTFPTCSLEVSWPYPYSFGTDTHPSEDMCWVPRRKQSKRMQNVLSVIPLRRPGQSDAIKGGWLVVLVTLFYTCYSNRSYWKQLEPCIYCVLLWNVMVFVFYKCYTLIHNRTKLLWSRQVCIYTIFTQKCRIVRKNVNVTSQNNVLE